MEYGCIGEHLPHSFSKIIHDMIGRYPYIIHEVAKDELHDFMTTRDFKGINVTIPYKQDVIPYLYEISDQAKAIGAVNTIVNKDGKLYGHNTDFGGMEALIHKMNLDFTGKKVLILGTGGTSKTSFAVATHLKAREIYKVSRTPSEGILSYEEAYEKHQDAEIIINTTPVGMFPKIENQAVDLTKFPNLTSVVDAVYNPLSSRLILQAKSLGLNAEGGLYMLVAQAVIAAEIYLEEKLPVSMIDEIYEKVLKEKQNISLVGMPGSGKSTVGHALSEKLGKEFVDTDALIVERAGMEITEIFKEKGEPWFRDLEAEILKEVSMKNGQIISSGGGAVLRTENVLNMKMNGPVLFIDRPVNALKPTDDRPLADTEDKMVKLYETRLPIYTAACDIHVISDGRVEDTINDTLRSL